MSVENSVRSSNQYEFMPKQFQFTNFRYCKKYYRKDKDSLKDVSLRFYCDIWYKWKKIRDFYNNENYFAMLTIIFLKYF